MSIKLKSVELVEENNQFYLDATYIKERNGIISEIHIPRIKTGFVRSDILSFDFKTYDSGDCGMFGTCTHGIDIDVGCGPLHLSETKGPDGYSIFYTEKYLEREMTVEEIEKQLGHRVKIVEKEATDG
jgi:hypothetical protein